MAGTVDADEGALRRVAERLGRPESRGTLARVLRACGGDESKAVECLESYRAWREAEVVGKELLSSSFPEAEEALKSFPCGYHGVDREGRPVYYQEMEGLDASRLLQLTTMERVSQMYVKAFEIFLGRLAPACSLLAGRDIGQQYTCVMNMRGVGMRHFSADCRALVRLTSSIAEERYPDTLHKLFIVNAGAAFFTAWAVLRPMLSAGTQQRVVVLRDAGVDTLVRHISPENIPVGFGGQSRRDIREYWGPWQSVLGPMHGVLSRPLGPPPKAVADWEQSQMVPGRDRVAPWRSWGSSAKEVAGSEASTNGDLTWRSSVDSEAGLAPGSSGSVTRDASSGSGRPWWRRRPQAEAPGPPGALARERGGRGSKCLPVWRRGRREREGSDVGVDVAATGARV